MAVRSITVLGTLEVSAQWLHAQYIDFVAAVGAVNVQYAGNRLPQSPEYTFGLALSHDWELPGRALLTARADSKMVARQQFQYQNYDSDRQEAYTKSNLFLIYKPAGDCWDLQAYLQNIENARVLTLAQEAGAYTVYRYALDAPRTFGATFTYRF